MMDSGATLNKQPECAWLLRWGFCTHIMAILNITPDSFSGDGLNNEKDVVGAAVTRAEQAVQNGAHILDVGGVSTSAGFETVSEEEEIGRILPVVEQISMLPIVRDRGVSISVDSCRPRVVEAALDTGAQIVNSTWGMRSPDGEGWNEGLAKVVSARRSPFVLTHNRPGGIAASDITSTGDDELDPIGAIIKELQADVDFALEWNIRPDQIVIDPGFGQGKTEKEDRLLLGALPRLCQLGYPVLIGASRKHVVGSILDQPPEQCDGGTAAVTALAAKAGVAIVRVHNVRLNAEVARVVDAVLR
jgi:dihydropteroate synthase